MIKATISSKGQIAIPKVVRDRLKLKTGMEVSISVQGETLLMSVWYEISRTGARCREWQRAPKA